MISSILFDFGGTLDSDGSPWLDRTYHIYRRVGLDKIDKNLIKEAFYAADAEVQRDIAIRASTYRDMMTRHLTSQFKKLNLKDQNKEAEAVSVFVRAAERVLHRNRKALEILSFAGYRMGVVANFYGNMETLCREFGYNKFLSVYVDSAVEGVSKPDPRIFQIALERLKTAPNHVMMVGDNFERDIIPAKALGMKTAWLIGDQKRVCPDPTQVDLTLRSIEELPERLKAISKEPA